MSRKNRMENEKRNKGFNLPEDYFENFEDRLELRIMEDALPDSNGFVVPEGYFNSLEDMLVVKVAASEPVIKPLFPKRSFYYVAGIAASLLLIISISGIFDNDTSLDEIPLSTIESYMEESAFEYDSYDVMALMDEQEIEDLILDENIISEESLEDYLLDNLEDTSPLLIE